MLHILRTSPCFHSYPLEVYDNLLKTIFSGIINTCLRGRGTAWTQLPVSYGGLGIRSAVQFAPSAFLASAAGSTNLICQTLPPRLQNIPYPVVVDTKLFRPGAMMHHLPLLLVRFQPAEDVGHPYKDPSHDSGIAAGCNGC